MADLEGLIKPFNSLQELLREPSVLSSESALLTTELTNLCHSEYPTFLHVHATSQTLSTSFTSLSTSLSSLLATLPALSSACSNFSQASKPILAERQKALLVLENHDKLMDILSLPQLIDQCVRSGLYQEAFDLAKHADTLIERFKDVPIIQSVEREVHLSTKAMIAQLLGVLKEPAKLPILFRAVSFLRKMKQKEGQDGWDEEELAIAFLTGRKANLQAVLEREQQDSTTSDGASRFIRKYVDTFREGVYEAVTQYNAIFLEPNDHELEDNLRYLLTIFTHQFIQSLLSMLQTHLPKVAPESLSKLLTQLTYCSTSFARIGLDFRSLLTPIFSDAVLGSAEKTFQTSQNSLISTLEANRKGFLLSSAPPPTPYLLDTAGSLQAPPQVLTHFPPLALYTNAIITGFNAIRLLPIIDILPGLLEALDTSLTGVMNAFVAQASKANVASPKSPITPTDRENDALISAGNAFSKLVIPFLRRGLVLGIYSSELETLGQAKALKEAISEWEYLALVEEPVSQNGSVTPAAS